MKDVALNFMFSRIILIETTTIYHILRDDGQNKGYVYRSRPHHWEISMGLAYSFLEHGEDKELAFHNFNTRNRFEP